MRVLAFFNNSLITQMKKILLIIKILLVVVFSYHTLDWKFEYSLAVKFVGLIGFGLLAYLKYKDDKMWFTIWLGSAILINPFLEIKLNYSLWSAMSIVWLVILVMSFFIKRIT